MIEYRWEIPERGERHAVLQIPNARGWFGGKRFTYAGRLIYKRGPFAGIDHEFTDSASGKPVHLQLRPVSGSPLWTPVLVYDRQTLKERTGNPLPRVVRRTKSVAIATGLTYLVMMLGAVILPSILNMLDALYSKVDNQKLVLIVRDSPNNAEAAKPAEAASNSNTGQAEDVEPLRIQSLQFPLVPVGEPVNVRLTATGGVPPYAWSHEKRGWPKGLTLDHASGELHGTPDRRGVDWAGHVMVIDSGGKSANGVFAMVVTQPAAPSADVLRIHTQYLPDAIAGESYRFDLDASGGQRPYTWRTVSGDLPKGLDLDRSTGSIFGTPKKAGSALVTLRAIDGSYDHWDDIDPWLIPYFATGICLLGYWNMRRWGVLLFGTAILAQVGLICADPGSVSTVAVAIEAMLLLLGAASWKQMD